MEKEGVLGAPRLPDGNASFSTFAEISHKSERPRFRQAHLPEQCPRIVDCKVNPFSQRTQCTMPCGGGISQRFGPSLTRLKTVAKLVHTSSGPRATPSRSTVMSLSGPDGAPARAQLHRLTRTALASVEAVSSTATANLEPANNRCRQGINTCMKRSSVTRRLRRRVFPCSEFPKQTRIRPSGTVQNGLTMKCSATRRLRRLHHTLCSTVTTGSPSLETLLARAPSGHQLVHDTGAIRRYRSAGWCDNQFTC